MDGLSSEMHYTKNKNLDQDKTLNNKEIVKMVLR